MTPQERLDYLLEIVETPRGRGATLTEVKAAAGEHEDLVDITLHRIKNPKITDEMTTEDIERLQVMAENMQQACAAMVNPTGLDLSTPKRQAMIDLLAGIGQWPDEVRDAIKSLGVRKQPRWQVEGYATEPTLEQVTEEINEALDQAARETVSTLLYGAEWNQHVAPILDGDRNTATRESLVSGLRNLADALEVV